MRRHWREKLRQYEEPINGTPFYWADDVRYLLESIRDELESNSVDAALNMIRVALRQEHQPGASHE